MKTTLLIFTCLLFSQFSRAQLKATVVCPTFQVDILEGNVNKIYATSTLGQIKEKFPCYTESNDSIATGCTTVFYKDKGLYFYPGRNYFEIKENFKGKLTPALMGASRSGLFKSLGNPKIKDLSWDAFQTQFGTLVLYYNKSGKVNKIQVSSKSTESLKLCD